LCFLQRVGVIMMVGGKYCFIGKIGKVDGNELQFRAIRDMQTPCLCPNTRINGGFERKWIG
jgi:hypothetical protein